MPFLAVVPVSAMAGVTATATITPAITATAIMPRKAEKAVPIRREAEPGIRPWYEVGLTVRCPTGASHPFCYRMPSLLPRDPEEERVGRAGGCDRGGGGRALRAAARGLHRGSHRP